MKKVALKLKLQISGLAIIKVFSDIRYVGLAIFAGFLTTTFIVWSLNLSLAQFIIFDAPLSFFEKLSFFAETNVGIYTTYGNAQTTSILIFSVLFGINVSLLTFVIKNQGLSRIPKKASAAGFGAAILGGGCIACGTSILAPIAATLGAGLTPFIQNLTVYLNIIGSLLILWSIYKLGQLCAFVFAYKN
jgi:hypothetical protein